MRTETIKLYIFAELSESAQDWAIQGYRALDDEIPWADEWRESLLKACEFFGLNCRDWSVSARGNSYCDVSMFSDSIGELVGVRAWKWLRANYDRELESCPFTGYCGDEVFLKPFRDFLERPTMGLSLDELFGDCASSWVQGWVDDMEYQSSDECIREYLLNADYLEFLASGEQY